MYRHTDLLNKAKENNVVILNIDKVIRNDDFVEYKCQEGHFRKILAGHFLCYKIKECNECFKARRKKEALDKLTKITQEKEGQILSEFKTTNDKVTIKCKHGHLFTTTVSSIISERKTWCTYCKTSKTEKYFIKHARNISLEYKTCRPSFLKYSKQPLELDIYSQEEGIAIEINGEQHYKYIPLFHRRPEGFFKQQKHDEFKIKACAEKKIILASIKRPDRKTQTQEYVVKTIEEELKLLAIPTKLNPEFRDMLSDRRA